MHKNAHISHHMFSHRELVMCFLLKKTNKIVYALEPTLALGLKNNKLNSGMTLRVETSCMV